MTNVRAFALVILFGAWGCESKRESAPAAAASGVASAAAPASGNDALTLCKEASTRYTGCMKKLLGEDVAIELEKTESRGIVACAHDPMTITMYRKCLPEPDCPGFHRCMMDFARTTAAP